ncbi:MAG: class I SAM-dependent methyltransferase [Actinobacteria bacterium]|nr:class I SAM-dependent methyltransferase [Actinomycetota bacterium]MBO0834482.1 class I SAM-dependent methyltransferase [Actinomycetota bacterium]
MALYDRIGQTYRATRRADPRIASAIVDALGDAASVVNVGAGSGSYEPWQTIAAIEPSSVMIAQRPPGGAPAVQAVAEHIPLRDHCADAAMAVLTVHHWSDAAGGLAEMRRIARRRLIFFTWYPQTFESFWLLSEYLPEAVQTDKAMTEQIRVLARLLPDAQVRPVPVPHDCVDGFAAAYWRRPWAYLDPAVRAGISMLAKTGEDALRAGLNRLDHDLRTGRWHEDHADLLNLDSLDVGYRILIAELEPLAPRAAKDDTMRVTATATSRHPGTAHRSTTRSRSL